MYLKLNDRYALHLHPGGGTLSVLPSLSRYENLSNATLTREAAELMSHCTGSIPLRQLLIGMQASAQELSEFITWAIESSFLDVYQSPQPGKISVTGSFDYFSPIHFCIELTDQCNLTCRHCYRESHPYLSHRLPSTTLIQIFADMREQGVKSIELTGGEPLMHPEFREILEAAVSNFTVVAILSNGWFIDESMASFLGRYHEQVILQVDLDGPCAEVHDRLRGVPGSFEHACAAIHWLSKYNIFVRAVTNVYSDNISYVVEVMELARALGASCFSSAVLMDFGRGSDIPMATAKEITAYAQLVQRLSQEHPRFFFPNQEVINRLKALAPGCGAGLTKLVLGPTGKLRLCLVMSENDNMMGNLTKISYRDFLASADLKLFHLIEPPDHNKCTPCEFARYCHGCIARSLKIRRQIGAHRYSELCSWDRQWKLTEKLQGYQSI